MLKEVQYYDGNKASGTERGEGVFALLIQYYNEIRVSVYRLDYLQN
jgi:hypothetical protein